jgi:hypothetical protein
MVDETYFDDSSHNFFHNSLYILIKGHDEEDVYNHTKTLIDNVLANSHYDKDKIILQLQNHIGKFSGSLTRSHNHHYKSNKIKSLLSDSKNYHNGSNLAHMACYKNHYTLMYQLTKAGVLNKLNTADKYGYYPLDLFIESVKTNCAKAPKGSDWINDIENWMDIGLNSYNPDQRVEERSFWEYCVDNEFGTILYRTNPEAYLKLIVLKDKSVTNPFEYIKKNLSKDVGNDYKLAFVLFNILKNSSKLLSKSTE